MLKDMTLRVFVPRFTKCLASAEILDSTNVNQDHLVIISIDGDVVLQSPVRKSKGPLKLKIPNLPIDSVVKMEIRLPGNLSSKAFGNETLSSGALATSTTIRASGKTYRAKLTLEMSPQRFEYMPSKSVSAKKLTELSELGWEPVRPSGNGSDLWKTQGGSSTKPLLLRRLAPKS